MEAGDRLISNDWSMLFALLKHIAVLVTDKTYLLY